MKTKESCWMQQTFSNNLSQWMMGQWHSSEQCQASILGNMRFIIYNKWIDTMNGLYHNKENVYSILLDYLYNIF